MNAIRAIERKRVTLLLAAVVVIAGLALTILHIHSARSKYTQVVNTPSARTLLAAADPSAAHYTETVPGRKRVIAQRRTYGLDAPKPRSVTQFDIQTAQEKLKERIQKGFNDIAHDDNQHVFQSPAVSAQATFEKEPVDDSWAPSAIEEIQDHLTQFGDRFDISAVDCRTDICQIEASARANGEALSDTLDFQNLWSSPEGQAWLDQQGFDDQISTVGSVEGIPIFVVFLSRK